jgi:copper chaperone CopZ
MRGCYSLVICHLQCQDSTACRFPHPSAPVFSLRVLLLQVEYDSSKIQAQALVEIIDDAGFEAELLSDSKASDQPPQVVKLQVFGMTCASCSSAVEGVLLEQKGVKKAGVNLTQGEAEVEFDPGRVSVVGASSHGGCVSLCLWWHLARLAPTVRHCTQQVCWHVQWTDTSCRRCISHARHVYHPRASMQTTAAS